MKPTDVPVNYVDGTWHFEAEFQDRHWELDVTPDLFLYTLQFPSGKRVEGTIPTLLTQLETPTHYPPQARTWLKNALSWDYRKSDYKEWEKTEKFTVEGREYSVTMNPRTGEVSLHFNPVIIVADRRHLNDYIPVYAIDQGRLSELLTTIVRTDGKELDNGDIGDVYMQLPAWTDRLEKHDLQGWSVWVAYEPSSDLIFLHMDARTVESHISTLETDVWELSSLHDGKYRETVMGILADNGFMDASL